MWCVSSAKRFIRLILDYTPWILLLSTALVRKIKWNAFACHLLSNNRIKNWRSWIMCLQCKQYLIKLVLTPQNVLSAGRCDQSNFVLLSYIFTQHIVSELLIFWKEQCFEFVSPILQADIIRNLSWIIDRLVKQFLKYYTAGLSVLCWCQAIEIACTFWYSRRAIRCLLL